MTNEIESYFEQRIPKAWFAGPVTITTDDEEILCVGELAAGAAVGEFRESTRAERVAIAADAESRFGRRVSWGVASGGTTTLFTSQSTPVMTRLRLRERLVLDTLVRGGVARSRSDALAWCVKLVGRHESDWLAELREALSEVDQVRGGGPSLA
jgi:hypothetical protein